MKTMEMIGNLNMVIARLEGEPKSKEEWQAIERALNDTFRAARAKVQEFESAELDQAFGTKKNG